MVEEEGPLIEVGVTPEICLTMTLRAAVYL